jgi:hypothetical protein
MATQLPPGKNNRSDHLTLTGKIPVAYCPVDRRNQIQLTSQSPVETTSELLLAMDSP